MQFAISQIRAMLQSFFHARVLSVACSSAIRGTKVVEDAGVVLAGAASSLPQANSEASMYPYHVPEMGFVLLERGGRAGARE
ncbi:hypothetical protein Acid345_4224 [Candidatus Koribacter versatilis Ellin345]|uniref:Uncharacterized protein n=1 Tax=Koribacter versatilis (strain Ellin345) TaxID=204669 RepID=Q1IIS6_KORVE|nr:hypothetical protein Acid345_4224 [Candidatus Koribacter versatilis Ellin345]